MSKENDHALEDDMSTEMLSRVSTVESTSPTDCSVLPALMQRIAEMENKRCASFPFHTICNEVVGLSFDDWCESCQARHMRKFFDEQNA